MYFLSCIYIFNQFYKWKPKIFSFFKEGETIIIGHRGEPSLAYEKTLESLIINQTNKADEIIVVNGGGLNNCESILQIWSKKFSKLKIIRTENINLANSRNIGLKECHGDLILLTDDDARPYPDWIENIKRMFKFIFS